MMNIKIVLNTMAAGVTGLVLLSGVALAAEGGPEDMKFAANCKPEGAGAAQCTEARRGLVKFALHCKMEGAEAERCKQAGDVVAARKLAEQPDVRGEDAGAAAGQKAAPAAAVAAAPAAAKNELDLKYAMHCKPEGAEAKNCTGMREKVGQYAAACKPEGADGERCNTAKKVMEALSAK